MCFLRLPRVPLRYDGDAFARIVLVTSASLSRRPICFPYSPCIRSTSYRPVPDGSSLGVRTFISSRNEATYNRDT